MSVTEAVERDEDSLNDSWEELTFRIQANLSQSPHQAASLSSSVIEKLLRDAQRESPLSSSRSAVSNASSSSASSTSPRSLRSLNTELPLDSFEVSLTQGTDGGKAWVWDWSSRPEIVPPWVNSPCLQPFKHPSSRRRTFSIRSSRLMQDLVASLEHLPLLILTHTCTFLLGAAAMLVILKKYYRFVAS